MLLLLVSAAPSASFKAILIGTVHSAQPRTNSKLRFQRRLSNCCIGLYFGLRALTIGLEDWPCDKRHKCCLCFPISQSQIISLKRAATKWCQRNLPACAIRFSLPYSVTCSLRLGLPWLHRSELASAGPAGPSITLWFEGKTTVTVPYYVNL